MTVASEAGKDIFYQGSWWTRLRCRRACRWWAHPDEGSAELDADL